MFLFHYSLTEKVFIEIFRAAADGKVAILHRL